MESSQLATESYMKDPSYWESVAFVNSVGPTAEFVSKFNNFKPHVRAEALLQLARQRAGGFRVNNPQGWLLVTADRIMKEDREPAKARARPASGTVDRLDVPPHLADSKPGLILGEEAAFVRGATRYVSLLLEDTNGDAFYDLMMVDTSQRRAALLHLGSATEDVFAHAPTECAKNAYKAAKEGAPVPQPADAQALAAASQQLSGLPSDADSSLPALRQKNEELRTRLTQVLQFFDSFRGPAASACGLDPDAPITENGVDAARGAKRARA